MQYDSHDMRGSATVSFGGAPATSQQPALLEAQHSAECVAKELAVTLEIARELADALFGPPSALGSIGATPVPSPVSGRVHDLNRTLCNLRALVAQVTEQVDRFRAL